MHLCVGVDVTKTHVSNFMLPVSRIWLWWENSAQESHEQNPQVTAESGYVGGLQQVVASSELQYDPPPQPPPPRAVSGYGRLCSVAVAVNNNLIQEHVASPDNRNRRSSRDDDSCGQQDVTRRGRWMERRNQSQLWFLNAHIASMTQQRQIWSWLLCSWPYSHFQYLRTSHQVVWSSSHAVWSVDSEAYLCCGAKQCIY